MQPARLGALVWFFVPTALLVILVLAPSSRAQQQQAVLETPQQTNDRIRQMSAVARMKPHDYVLGNGDVLDLDVFDVKELSKEVRISQTGSIGIPLVPVRLHVAGLTEVQAQQKIAEVLEANGLVSHADVSLSVKERKSKPITVVGAVGHAMVYQADHAVTLLEVLAEAGGVATDAGDIVIVTRPVVEPAPDSYDPSEPPAIGSEASGSIAGVPGSLANSQASTEPPPLSTTITINLNELMETGNVANNIVLQAGDIVTVPHSGIVYVLGSVARPGGFVLANDRGHMTTLKVLALAGGVSITAKSDHSVIIRRDAQGQQHEVPVDLKKVMHREAEDIQLQPSDILYVPNSAAKQVLIRSMEFAVALASSAALYRVAYH
jgi:polysaccharide export outer membrane protein